MRRLATKRWTLLEHIAIATLLAASVGAGAQADDPEGTLLDQRVPVADDDSTAGSNASKQTESQDLSLLDNVAPVADDATDASDASDQAESQDLSLLDQVAPVADDTTDVSDDSNQAESQDLSLLDQVVPVADDATDDFEAVTVPQLSDSELLMQEYELYKRLMDEKVFDEADSVAKRVIELAIRVKGPKSLDTARALTNLGIVQHRTRQYEAAQQNFESAIEIIEDQQDRLTADLVNPLKGLGAAQLESGRADLASDSFHRAVHITHVNEGPHNADQLELLESLAETNLRLGALDKAKQVHDQIYALNLKHHNDEVLDIVPSLMRRAAWQHRAGFINDERATYRHVIRIIESDAGKDDLRLIEPLTNLGQSFFYVDLTGAGYDQQSVTNGEIYFRRALRIAENSPQSNWQTVARARLALGDFYMFDGNHSRARKVYLTAWDWLSEDESRFDYRDQLLGQPVSLRETPLPRYAGATDQNEPVEKTDNMLRGTITMTYNISPRGRISDLKIIEADPPEFEQLQLVIQREMRRRVYRPKFEDAQAVEAPDQLLTHTFFYRQSDLDAVVATPEAADTDDPG